MAAGAIRIRRHPFGEEEIQLREQFGIRRSGVGLVLLLFLALNASAARAEDFRPHGSIKLEYENERDKTGSETTETSTFSQDYEVQFQGYIWRRDFVTFDSLFGYSDSMTDDSEAGESRDRDIDFYDVTAVILPEWPAPLTFYTKKNLILLDSDGSPSSESWDDTYRLNWHVTHGRLPEIEIEFERTENFSEEPSLDTTTSDSRDDIYELIVSKTYGRIADLKFEYRRNESVDNLERTEDVSNSVSLSGASEISSNFQLDARVEYNDQNQESSLVATNLAMREDVDAVTGILYFDAVAGDIGNHMAVELTPSGNPDFTGWTPSAFSTTISLVNNSQITFDDAIPGDVMVVIEYQTQDGFQYFDIYRGDDTADTYGLTVTQVIIADVFDDFLVFAEYIDASSSSVNLDFSAISDPEPISSLGWPIEDVDVTIAYNTRSRSHFEDDFRNVDIEQTGTSFDLTKVRPGETEDFLFNIEISYLPIPPLDFNLRYEFTTAEDESETTTDHSIDGSVATAFFERLHTTTDLSYLHKAIDHNLDPDIVGDPTGMIEKETSEEWRFRNNVEYGGPLPWGTYVVNYEFSYELREEDRTGSSDNMSHTVDFDLLLGRTDIKNKWKYDESTADNIAPAEDTWDKEFNYRFGLEHQRSLWAASSNTNLEYDYKLDKSKDSEDSTTVKYSFEEEIAYKQATFTTLLEHNDDKSGDDWTKKWMSDTEIQYSPFRWLDLTSGYDWTRTEDELETGTETQLFIEADIHRSFARTGTFELGIRKDWLTDDRGENESTFGIDASVTYNYADVDISFEADYEQTMFDGESDDTENISFAITLERQF
jgi:hypothetical protein